MAVTFEYALGITGLALTGRAFLDSSGDVAGVAIIFVEDTNRSGYYRVASSSVPAGMNWFKITGGIIDSMWAMVPASGVVKLVPSWFEAASTVQTSDGGSTGGTGSLAVTIAVADSDSNPVQGARVTAKLNGSLVAFKSTSAGGSALLGLDAASYQILITAPGFNTLTATLVVSADLSHTYTLDRITITPSDPPFVTGYLVCRDQFNATMAGVPHTLKLIRVAVDATGGSLSRAARTVVSDVNGLVQFTDLVVGAEYRLQRANGQNLVFTAGGTDFPIDTIAG